MTVRFDVRDGVALITLDDPERRNAISLGMTDALLATFDEIEARPDVGAVVVTGAGSAFCAGADLRTLQEGDPRAYAHLYEGFLRVARSTLPTIAAVNGAATGAGMNVALCCDVRVAAHRARFVTRFAELGLHPGGGHTWMLERAVGRSRALAMLLMGEELDGRQAAEHGLALRAVPDDELLDTALSLAGRAATVPRALNERVKATLDAVSGLDRHEDAVAIESDAQAWSVQQAFFQERVAAMLARVSTGGRKP